MSLYDLRLEKLNNRFDRIESYPSAPMWRNFLSRFDNKYYDAALRGKMMRDPHRIRERIMTMMEEIDSSEDLL